MLLLHGRMEGEPLSATRIVDLMFTNDSYSQWLGIERLEDGIGKSVLRLTIRPEMLNGFGIGHGSIAYAIADSALAFASNGHGIKCVSIETSISHVKAVGIGDVLIATAEERNISKRFGIYEVTVRNHDSLVVALFKGTVFRTGEVWTENSKP